VPAPGGVVPRLFATLSLQDEAAARALLPQVFGKSSKQVEYDGVALTTVDGTDMPPAFQPTCCVHEGRLHLTESVASMRALLKAQRDGVDAMHVGDVPAPEGPGAPLTTFDLRWDEAAIYRAFRDVWLPLYEIAMGPAGEPMKPLLRRDDLPRADVVAPHLGAGRGVLLRDGNTWMLRQTGTLGGPLLAALAMAWGPIASGYANNDFVVESLGREVGKRRLEAVWPALQAFFEQHERWPNDLGELFTAAKLPADALWVPGDELAEAVPMPAGHAGTVRSSFKYSAPPVDFDTGHGRVRALFVELRHRPYNRLVLADDGSLPDVYHVETAVREVEVEIK
jgi:hypothetical protein